MARGWNQMIFKVPSNPSHFMIPQPTMLCRHPPGVALTLTCLPWKKIVGKMLFSLLIRKSKGSFIAAYTLLLSECCCTWWRTKLQTSAGGALWLSEGLCALQEGIRQQEFHLASKKFLAMYTKRNQNILLFYIWMQFSSHITSRLSYKKWVEAGIRHTNKINAKNTTYIVKVN